jgi:hypothetical protein
MKKSLAIIAILLISGLSGIAQVAENLISFKKGTVLVYEMEKNNQKYPLTITIESTKPNLVFSYNIEDAQKRKGSITINGKTLAKSSKLIFDFRQPKLTLTDATCLFVNKDFNDKIESIATKIYWDKKESADTMTIPLKLENIAAPVIFGQISREVEDLKVNGKLRQFHTNSISNVKDSKGKEIEIGTSYMFRISKDIEFPVVTYANMIMYTMVLVEIKNAQWLKLNFATNEYEKVDDVED